MSTIIHKLEASGYDPSAQELEEFLTLAKNTHTVDSRITGGYFKILLHRAIKVGSVDKANGELYPEVKRVCTTKDMTAIERNKATNFARSAYSTLRKADKAGWHLGQDDTKEQMTAYIKATKPKAVGKTATLLALDNLDAINTMVVWDGADLVAIRTRFNELFPQETK